MASEGVVEMPIRGCTLPPAEYGVPLFDGVRFLISPTANAVQLAEGAYYALTTATRMLQQERGEKRPAETADAAEVLTALALAAVNEIGRRVDPKWNIA